MEKKEESPKCVCGEQICLGMAEVEIAGVCHRPNNPCYIMDNSSKHTPDIVEEMSNLQTELLAMIESGSIKVGALGLSEYAYNTLKQLDRITRELHQQGFKDGERAERIKSEKLWDILDHIDSLPDMIHPNTPEGHEKCWRMMVRRAEKRHDILQTDGYTLKDK